MPADSNARQRSTMRDLYEWYRATQIEPNVAWTNADRAFIPFEVFYTGGDPESANVVQPRPPMYGTAIYSETVSGRRNKKTEDWGMPPERVKM